MTTGHLVDGSTVILGPVRVVCVKKRVDSLGWIGISALDSVL